MLRVSASVARSRTPGARAPNGETSTGLASRMGGDGPSAPKVEKPNTEELLKKMRKVDPDQAKRYRQRTGQ